MCGVQTHNSIQYFSVNGQRTQDPVPTTADMWTVHFSPKVPTPKPNMSKAIVKPTVGTAKSSSTTTSNKTTNHSGRVIKPPTKLNL